MMQDDTLDMKIGFDPLIAYCHVQLDAMAKCIFSRKTAAEMALNSPSYSILILNAVRAELKPKCTCRSRSWIQLPYIYNKQTRYLLVHVWEKKNGYDVTYTRCKDRL